MSLKSIIWTVVIAAFTFFIAVYLGMKYNWVEDAEPKLLSSANVKQTDATGSVSLKNTTSLALDKNAKKPILIDEPMTTDKDPILLGSLNLSIEDIVSQCQALTQSVGIPDPQIEQAMTECINRNSTHLTQNSLTGNEKTKVIEEQCNSAITQRELLSQEEIKMLLDECVASSL